MRTLSLPIATARLTLREFRASDLEAIITYSSDPRVTRYMFFGPRDEESSREYLHGVLESQAERPRNRYELAVERNDTGEVIGACELSMIERGVMDLGYMLAHGSWGCGYATEIALALADAAFFDLAAERVISTVEINNRASIKVVEKVGMQWEATYRKARRAKNRWWDCHMYVLARTVWESQRMAGEKA
jgi:RimJ/RimL family protein N-acetyltransferase